MAHEKIIEEVGNYYAEKVQVHGATPQGVDWNGEASQHLRFQQLCRIMGSNTAYSVLDYGSGFGSLYGYLQAQGHQVQYTGFDIADDMLAKGRELYGQHNGLHWVNDLNQAQPADYCVASGIFNVRLKNTDAAWQAYITDTLATMHQYSQKGFAFNVLTKYSDAPYMRDYLYYADPAWLFDHCKRHYSRHVALLHDYPLYEFTIIVRKDL